MKKKIVALGLTVTILGSIFSGCGSSSSTAATETSSVTEEDVLVESSDEVEVEEVLTDKDVEESDDIVAEVYIPDCEDVDYIRAYLLWIEMYPAEELDEMDDTEVRIDYLFLQEFFDTIGTYYMDVIYDMLWNIECSILTQEQAESLSPLMALYHCYEMVINYSDYFDGCEDDYEVIDVDNYTTWYRSSIIGQYVEVDDVYVVSIHIHEDYALCMLGSSSNYLIVNFDDISYIKSTDRLVIYGTYEGVNDNGYPIFTCDYYEWLN